MQNVIIDIYIQICKYAKLGSNLETLNTISNGSGTNHISLNSASGRNSFR